MNASELLNSIIAPSAYYLCGDDSFWLKSAEDKFRNVLSPDSLSLYVIDRITDINEIQSSLTVCNFDESPNVVLVRDTDYKATDSDHSTLLKLLKSEIAPNYLVFCNVNFLNAAEKKLVTNIDCNKIDKYGCIKYITKLFPYGIENSAASLLADYTECNMAKINNECEKLVAYCGTNRVTVDDVDMLVTEDTEIQVFSFANNIVSAKYSLAMKQLDKMRKYGVAPAMLLSTLIGQFQRMLYCAISPLSDAELAAKLGIKEYAVKKSREIRGFGKVELKNTLNMLLEYEYKFKNGEISDAMAFDCAVSRLICKEQ